MLSALKIDHATTRDLLTGFIRNEVQRTGLSRVVLGLSGGIDSALAAWLSVLALGADQVLGVLMPYTTSNPESEQDALLVADTLGIRREVVPIGPIVDPLIATDPEMDRLRRGNLMARVRMILLYDRSARDGSLVVGTGNKTEILLGYSTLHGDSACALNPLGDLYKSQVWKLSRFLGIPSRIVDKAPSADLWSGQTDEAELGFTYKQVDELLYYMIDERRSIEELIDLGFESAFIHRVQTLVRRNQFKRMPAIIAKVGARTINDDFRYPRDWGM